MSALDSGQFAAGIVWVNSGAAVGAFGVGNDSTGDGLPATPYLSIDQALKEWRIAEGQAVITKQVTIRAITDDGTTVYTYARVTRTTNATYPETGTPAFFVIIEGWARTWGTSTKGKWADVNDKPEWGSYTNDNAGATDQGIRLLEITDFTLNDDATNIIDLHCIIPGDVRKCLVYHCRFKRPTVTNLFTLDAGDSALGNEFGVFGCTTDKGLSQFSGFVMNSQLDNGGTGNCQNILDLASGTDRKPTLFNNIYLCDGVGFFCLDNVGNTSGWITALARTGNVYHITGGASFLRQQGGGTVESVFTVHSPQDVESFGIDPQLATAGEPGLSNSSPILDKGVSMGGILSFLVDPTGNDNELRDALGEGWGDSIELDTPLTVNAISRVSQRSPGPVQNALGEVVVTSQLVTPKGVIPFNTPFVVGEVGLDQDVTGTCQAKIIQADDAGGVTNRKTIHSSPLNITAGDNKLDISEDGGGDVAITMTVLAGGYNTIDLHTELQTKLNAAGLTGTYTVSFNTVTGITTISATGLTSGFEIKFTTGANQATNCSRWFGYDPIDTVQATSLLSDVPLEQNGYNAAIDWEWSATYVAGDNPSTTGAPWVDIGTGDPSDGGTEGVDGVDCTGLTRFVRANIGDIFPLIGKFHSYQDWNGNMRTFV